MERFATLPQSKLVAGPSISFWLLVAAVLVIAGLVHADMLHALSAGTLCLIGLGYSLYGTRFTHLAWRARSVPHHALWFVAAGGSVATAALAVARLLV